MREFTTSFRARSLASFAMLLSLTLISACSDDSSPIGSDYLPENVEFRTYTLRPSDFTITSGVANVSNSTGEGAATVVVGRAPDGTVAHGLLALTDVVDRVSSAGAPAVTSAKLKLRTLGYLYPDKNARNVTFDVVVLDRPLTLTMKYDDISSELAAATPIGSFTGPYPDSTVVEVVLDPTATTAFLKSYYERVVNETTGATEIRTLKIIALRARPDASGVGNFLGATFPGVADSLRATIQVTNADTTAELDFGVSNWVASLPLTPGPGKLIAAAGVPIRTFVSLRLDSIPSTSAIHQAELILHVDSSRTRYGSTGESVAIVAYVGDATSPTSLTSTLGFYRAARTAVDSTRFSDVVSFPSIISSLAAWQQSRRGGGAGISNNGLVIALNRALERTVLESSTVDRIAFHGFDAADSTLWPSLTITYSIRTDAN